MSPLWTRESTIRFGVAIVVVRRAGHMYRLAPRILDYVTWIGNSSALPCCNPRCVRNRQNEPCPPPAVPSFKRSREDGCYSYTALQDHIIHIQELKTFFCGFDVNFLQFSKPRGKNAVLCIATGKFVLGYLRLQIIYFSPVGLNLGKIM